MGTRRRKLSRGAGTAEESIGRIAHAAWGYLDHVGKIAGTARQVALPGTMFRRSLGVVSCIPFSGET